MLIHLLHFLWFAQTVLSQNEFMIQTAAPDVPWSQVAMSASGQHVFGTTVSGDIYASADYGASWNLSIVPSHTGQAYGISTDSSGQYVYACDIVSGNVFNSSDYGSSFSVFSDPSFAGLPLHSISCDASGRYLTVCVGSGGMATTGGIFASDDYGATWQTSDAPARSWYELTADATGQYLAAAAFQSFIYVSSDYGLTWYVRIAV